jgi:hypothetical protein
MDGIVLLFVLLVVAIIALPIIAIVTANSRANQLRAEMADLIRRVHYLEEGLENLVRRVTAAAQPSREATQAVVATPAPAPRAVPPVPLHDVEVVATSTPRMPEPEPTRVSATLHPESTASFVPPRSPQFAAPPPTHPSAQIAPPRFGQPPAPEPDEPSGSERAFSLEERLGTNWLNKLGIALLVLGVAFFLAWKIQTWGPAGKVLCGFAVSFVLLAGGVWLERKKAYQIFARAGIGGGWALAFFTTFAMHHIAAARVVHSLVADLVLMLLVAAGMVAHSLRYRSQTVTGLAFLLGFATLLTSHLEAASGTVVFSLTASAILALGLVVVTTVRHWAVLEAVGLVAVYLSHFVWLTRVLPPDHAAFVEFWPSVVLIVMYWVIFRLAYVLRTPLDDNEENVSTLAAVLNAGGVLGLLKYQAAHPEWAWWALAAMGAIEMALSFTLRARRRKAFVVLSAIGVVLLVAAVPFKFHGVSWPVLWLIEAQVLALCGLRMDEPVFRRLGLLAGLATGAVLAIRDVVPLVLFRLDYADPNHHVSLTVALALAAVLYWIHGEVYPRRWPHINEQSDFEAIAMGITSFLAVAAAASALWVALPAVWVVPSWLALAVLMGFVAQRFKAASVGMQADLLAAAAVIGWFPWILWSSGSGWWDHKAPMLLSVALVYAGMRGKPIPGDSRAPIALGYSWVASTLVAITAANLSSDLFLAVVWAALGVALFEVGRASRIASLRWQGILLAGAAFAKCLAFDVFDNHFGGIAAPTGYPAPFSPVHSALFEVLVLAAVGYWLFERTLNRDRCKQAEHVAGTLTDGLGTLAIALWFAYRFPSDWVPVPNGAIWVTSIWAAMATVLMGAAWLMRRRAFVVWAVALAVATVMRGVFFDLEASTPEGFWNGSLFHVALAAGVMLAALPFAFKLRKPELWAGDWIEPVREVAVIIRRPEQWFFFAPFGLMVVALAVKLSSGHITIAWSVMGVAVFLFALAVGERSFRLAGLALLLVSVVKILLMDVWALAPPDRYTTLIVLGLALLGVSFLYTRFGTVIRKYL